MLYFIDPISYAENRDIFAFISIEERDIYAPEYTVQLPYLPEGYHKDHHYYDGKKWVNYRPAPIMLTEEELTAERDRLIAAAELRIAPLQDAVDLGIATEDEQIALQQWKRYRVELMRLLQSEGWPTDVAWPDAPR